MISFQQHILPGSAVIESDGKDRAEPGNIILSEEKEEGRSDHTGVVPCLLTSLEKGLALLRLTVDSKVTLNFSISFVVFYLLPCALM